MSRKHLSLFGVIVLVFTISTRVYAEGVSANNVASEEVINNGVFNIDENIFSNTSVKLNTEIYNDTAEIINSSHMNMSFGDKTSNLFRSYAEYLDPLMPMALSICETGCWIDTRYTWCSAVYSEVLLASNVDMSNLDIKSVDSDMFIMTGNGNYLGCGRNCTAPEGTHYHFVGINDNDSLGPLQIRRHYVENNGYIKYSDGGTVVDLMSWKDNLEYFFHSQGNAFSSPDNWNSDYSVQNKYELMALIGVGHNTGLAFQTSRSDLGDAGSLWFNSASVYNYCKAISSEKAISILHSYVDEWYVGIKEKAIAGEKFSMAGQSSTADWSRLLDEIGVNKSLYATSFGHKQYYPLKAILNYMSLEKLYSSGLEGSENGQE